MKKYTLIVFIFLTGCVTVNQQLLPKVPVQTPPSTKGLLETKVGDVKQLFNGGPSPGGMVDTVTAVNAYLSGMMIQWKSNDYISDYGKAGELKNRPDYILSLSGTINENGSILGAVATGLTLFLIPSSNTMTYDMTATFTNVTQKKSYTIPLKNASSTWMQILLFPALPFSWLGSHHMMQDSANYLYAELRKQGAFETGINNKSDLQTAH